MYLHIGNFRNIRQKDIIGIFDSDTATVSAVTRNFLVRTQNSGLVETAGNQLPKSMILYRDKDKFRICFSQLSASALLGRTELQADGRGSQNK